LNKVLTIYSFLATMGKIYDYKRTVVDNFIRGNNKSPGDYFWKSRAKSHWTSLMFIHFFSDLHVNVLILCLWKIIGYVQPKKTKKVSKLSKKKFSLNKEILLYIAFGFVWPSYLFSVLLLILDIIKKKQDNYSYFKIHESQCN